MNKVEVGTLDSHELFEHRGVIYQLLTSLLSEGLKIPG